MLLVTVSMSRGSDPTVSADPPDPRRYVCVCLCNEARKQQKANIYKGTSEAGPMGANSPYAKPS